MAERSRPKQNVRSPRIKVSPRFQYSPKERRRNVYLDKEDIYSSDKLVKTFGDEEPVRRPRSEELETYVKRSESDEPNVRYVTRSSYQGKQPIGCIRKEQVADEKALPEYMMQRPSTRNVRCQMTTHYVIQPQQKKRKTLHNEQPIRYVTKIQADDEKAFRRQEYINCPQEYIRQSPELRNVCCQITTHYVVLSHSKQRRHNEQTQTEIVVPQPDIPSSGTSTSSTLLSPRDKSPDNIEVNILEEDDLFELLYPKPPKIDNQIYIDSTPTTKISERPTETESTSKSLESPSESLQPDSFDGFKFDIVSKPKQIVTVGGGWNTMDDYMERHDAVQGFVYEREQLKKSDLPENKKKYYGFKSNYKYPQYKTPYHFYKSKPFFRKLTNDR